MYRLQISVQGMAFFTNLFLTNSTVLFQWNEHVKRITPSSTFVRAYALADCQTIPSLQIRDHNQQMVFLFLH